MIAKEIASGAAADVVLIAQPAMKDSVSGLDSPVLVSTNEAAIGINTSAVGKIKEAKDLMEPGIKIAEGKVVGEKADTAKVTEMVESGTADAMILYESNIDPARLAMTKLGSDHLVTGPTLPRPLRF